MPRGIPNNPEGRLSKKKRVFLARSEGQKRRYARERREQGRRQSDAVAEPLVEVTLAIPRSSMELLTSMSEVVSVQPEMLGAIILDGQLRKAKP